MKKKHDRDYFVSCILAAGGSGARMESDINKIFIDLCDMPVLAHCLITLQENDHIDEIIIAARECDLPGCNDIVYEFGINKVKTITVGGATRQESVKKALCEVSKNAEIVLVHDAARPLVRTSSISDVVLGVTQFGAAAVGVPVKNTLKYIDDDGFISSTPDRSNMYEIHTPQGFTYDLIKRIYENADALGLTGTDDCYLAEQLDVKIKMITGSYDNIKITTAEDLIIAEQLFLNRL